MDEDVAIRQRKIAWGKWVANTCNFNLTRLNEVDYSLTNRVQKPEWERASVLGVFSIERQIVPSMHSLRGERLFRFLPSIGVDVDVGFSLRVAPRAAGHSLVSAPRAVGFASQIIL